MKTRTISLEDAEFVAHRLATELMSSQEPMPAFATRYPGKLESCLKQPFQSIGGHSLYPRFAEKAAILFYLVIKNHPFSNGNKRMAVTLTMVFFYVNKRWIRVPPTNLYKIACDVAESKPEEKEIMIRALTMLFEKYQTKQ